MPGRLTRTTLTALAVLAGAVASAQMAQGSAPPTRPPFLPASPVPTSVSPDAGAASGDARPVGRRVFRVVADEMTVVDESRPAPARNDSTTAGRLIRTLVLRPDGAPGPVPLVVFAHGYDTEPETYDPLLYEWAAAGYEVAAPELPGSAADLPGVPQRDIADQARDLSFVVTAVLARDVGTIDATRIVAAGHSDGGSAVALVALNSAYADSRFSDFLILSGAIPDQVVDGVWGPGASDRRLLLTVGDADEFDNLSAAQSIYDETTLPAALVVVPGGDHRDIYLSDSPTAHAVRAMTTDFLDLVTDETRTASWGTFPDDTDFAVQLRVPAAVGPR